MRRRRPAAPVMTMLALVLLSPTISSGGEPAGPDAAHLIVPGKSFGLVTGATSVIEINALYGASNVSALPAADIEFLPGATGDMTAYRIAKGTADAFDVIYPDAGEMFVCTTSPSFRTREGVGAGSSIQAVTGAWGAFTLTGFTDHGDHLSSASVGGVQLELAPASGEAFHGGRNREILGHYEMGPDWDPGSFRSDDPRILAVKPVIHRICTRLADGA